MSVANQTSPEPTDFREALTRSVREHWVLYLIEGVVLIVLGLLAIAVPLLAGLAATIFLGWLFLISGIVGLVTTFRARRAPGFWWALLSSVLALLAGAVLLWWPLQGMISLTFVLIAYFLIDGIASIMMAVEHRQGPSRGWGWLFASGVVDIVLAIMLFLGLPGTAAWAVGLLVGIDLVFGGVSLVALAVSAHKSGQVTA